MVGAGDFASRAISGVRIAAPIGKTGTPPTFTRIEVPVRVEDSNSGPKTMGLPGVNGTLSGPIRSNKDLNLHDAAKAEVAKAKEKGRTRARLLTRPTSHNLDPQLLVFSFLLHLGSPLLHLPML